MLKFSFPKFDKTKIKTSKSKVLDIDLKYSDEYIDSNSGTFSEDKNEMFDGAL